MGMILYPIYNVYILITLIIAINELICLCFYPLYITRLTYIQLEHSAVKATLIKQIANILRTLCSFIISPFCTSLYYFKNYLIFLVYYTNIYSFSTSSSTDSFMLFIFRTHFFCFLINFIKYFITTIFDIIKLLRYNLCIGQKLC